MKTMLGSRVEKSGQALIIGPATMVLLVETTTALVVQRMHLRYTPTIDVASRTLSIWKRNKVAPYNVDQLVARINVPIAAGQVGQFYLTPEYPHETGTVTMTLAGAPEIVTAVRFMPSLTLTADAQGELYAYVENGFPGDVVDLYMEGGSVAIPDQQVVVTPNPLPITGGLTAPAF